MLSFQQQLIPEHDDVHAAFQCFVEEGGVLGLGFHELRRERGFLFGIEEDEVGGLTRVNGNCGQPHETPGFGAVAFDDQVPAEFSDGDKVVVQ